MPRGPGCRGKCWDALDWRVCKSWKDVGEVITGQDFEPAAAFNDGEYCRDAWAGVFAADMDPSRTSLITPSAAPALGPPVRPAMPEPRMPPPP